MYLLSIHGMAAGRDTSIWDPIELAGPGMGTGVLSLRLVREALRPGEMMRTRERAGTGPGPAHLRGVGWPLR